MQLCGRQLVTCGDWAEYRACSTPLSAPGCADCSSVRRSSSTERIRPHHAPRAGLVAAQEGATACGAGMMRASIPCARLGARRCTTDKAQRRGRCRRGEMRRLQDGAFRALPRRGRYGRRGRSVALSVPRELPFGPGRKRPRPVLNRFPASCRYPLRSGVLRRALCAASQDALALSHVTCVHRAR